LRNLESKFWGGTFVSMHNRMNKTCDQIRSIV